MLIIETDKPGSFRNGRYESQKRSGSWHVGETLRVPAGRVITFQADGHELQAILEMFRKSGVTVEYPATHLTPIL